MDVKKATSCGQIKHEAEYRSLAHTAAELSWIQSLLRELHVRLPKPPSIFCDNLGATYLTINPAYHSRTKHVEIDFHFVHEKVARGDLQVEHIPTVDQHADLLTEGLSK